MSSSGAEAGVKGDQTVVESGRTGCGGDADDSLGSGTDRGQGGHVHDIDRDGLIRWEDNIAHLTLGTDRIAPLAYAPGLEPYHPIMGMIREPGGHLQREREKERSHKPCRNILYTFR